MFLSVHPYRPHVQVEPLVVGWSLRSSVTGGTLPLPSPDTWTERETDVVRDEDTECLTKETTNPQTKEDDRRGTTGCTFL